ncbi:hypothetical protein D9M71_79180 [compost metagenome]
MFAALHPGEGSTRTPDFVEGQPIRTAFDAVHAFLGTGEDQAIVEALHIAQFGGCVEQRERRQGLFAEHSTPAQFVVVGLHRFEIGRVDVETTAGVADLYADIGQLEALAERGVDLLASHRRESHADVGQHVVVADFASLHGHRVGVLDFRQWNEIVELGGGVFVTQSAIDGPLVVEAVLQLGKHAGADGGQVRHVGQLADLLEHAATAGVVERRIEDVEGHVAALAVEVAAPYQFGVFAQGRAERQATAKDFAVLHHLVHVAASGGHATRIEGREAGEVVAVVELGRQFAAKQVLVAVLEVGDGALDLVLLVQLQATQGACRDGPRRQGGNRRIGRVVAVLPGVEVIQRQLDALILVEAQPQFPANVVGVGVEQVTLAGFRRDAMAIGIEGAADVAGTQVQGIVDLSLRAGEMVLEFAAEAVVIQLGQRGGTGQRGFCTCLSTGRAGGDVDDAPGSAGAVDGVAAMNHFHAFDQGRIDIGQVARGVPVGIQRNAVDQNQHGAAAQSLPVVGDGAAGVRHARDALGQQGGQVVGALAKLFQLLALDDVHLAGLGNQRARRPRRGDFHGRKFHRRGIGRTHAGCCRFTRHHDEGVLILLLNLQAAIVEQALQRFRRGETTAQRRRPLAGCDVAGEENLGAGLSRQGIQRLFKRRSGQIEVDLVGRLHHRRQAEQQAAGQQGMAPGRGSH